MTSSPISGRWGRRCAPEALRGQAEGLAQAGEGDRWPVLGGEMVEVKVGISWWVVHDGGVNHCEWLMLVNVAWWMVVAVGWRVSVGEGFTKQWRWVLVNGGSWLVAVGYGWWYYGWWPIWGLVITVHGWSTVDWSVVLVHDGFLDYLMFGQFSGSFMVNVWFHLSTIDGCSVLGNDDWCWGIDI